MDNGVSLFQIHGLFIKRQHTVSSIDAPCVLDVIPHGLVAP